MQQSCHCIPETKEFPDSLTGYPERFEVHCAVHGCVFTYGVNTIRLFGEKEVQRKIDRAWETHAASIEN